MRLLQAEMYIIFHGCATAGAGVGRLSVAWGLLACSRLRRAFGRLLLPPFLIHRPGCLAARWRAARRARRPSGGRV